MRRTGPAMTRWGCVRNKPPLPPGRGSASESFSQTRWLLCAVILASSCPALAIEITLPLNLDTLKPLLEAVRKEGVGAVRMNLEQAQQRARDAGDLRSEAYALAGLA